jgi:hypothetical protein
MGNKQNFSQKLKNLDLMQRKSETIQGDKKSSVMAEANHRERKSETNRDVKKVFGLHSTQPLNKVLGLVNRNSKSNEKDVVAVDGRVQTQSSNWPYLPENSSGNRQMCDKAIDTQDLIGNPNSIFQTIGLNMNTPANDMILFSTEALTTNNKKHLSYKYNHSKVSPPFLESHNFRYPTTPVKILSKRQLKTNSPIKTARNQRKSRNQKRRISRP